ncbi:MAG: hypothetical protein ACYCWE_14525 [Eubacteriales bacterium]
MGPGRGFNMGMHSDETTEKLKEPKPKSIKEIPGYLKRLISKFFLDYFIFFQSFGKPNHGYFF